MASYAMAHLKLDMLLQKTGYKSTTNERLRIFLTNSLDEANKQQQQLPFAEWLSNEANEANSIKENVPVMVVLGNPPYNISSQNKSKWINDLMAIYKTNLNERNIQPLSDDYIKFIRYGQYFVDKNGSGILAYISNNSFVDGLIHRQMRKNLSEIFDKIYILNLHGNAKKKEIAPDGGKDENVFDIQQGVSINIFVKTGRTVGTLAKSPLPARVFHYDLYGKRKEKYSFLLNNNIKSVAWNELPLTAPQYFFVPKNDDNKEEYEAGFKITELLPISSSGVKTHDDSNLVDFSSFPANNQTYNYRPFDPRYINYDLKKVKRDRFDVMKHFLKGENVGLCLMRSLIDTDELKSVFISKNMIDINFYRFQSYIFPLYLYIEGDVENGNRMHSKKKPNLNPSIVKELAQRLDLSLTDEKESDENTFAPIDLLDYIYAVLHSPSYRERYKEFLKIDFPRVPYPQDVAQFRALATLGAKLRRLHLLEGVEPVQGVATYPKEGNNNVEKLSFQNDKVWINDTQYFDNVPSIAYDFYIGGYQPAQKWLKDRKGRTLSYDDIVHYQRIITVLQGTAEVMGEIDEGNK
jgi:predicted helicase